MRIADFDFRPSLLPSLVFVLVLAMLISLGAWQLRRAGEKEEMLAEREQRVNESVLDLSRAMRIEGEDRFRRAVAKGRYSSDRQWLLDNRVMHGQPGYHVFSLFELSDRDAPLLLVNRGWVSQGESRQFLPDLPLPSGEVELAGRLDSPASVGIRMGEVELNSLARLILVPYLDIDDLEAALGRPVYRFALVLDEQQPGSLVRDWAKPEEMITPDKHLGYAVQWFALAVALSIIYVGVNSRRIDKGDDKDAGEESSRG
jgi:surfeit locus 1 family protein